MDRVAHQGGNNLSVCSEIRGVGRSYRDVQQLWYRDRPSRCSAENNRRPGRTTLQTQVSETRRLGARTIYLRITCIEAGESEEEEVKGVVRLTL